METSTEILGRVLFKNTIQDYAYSLLLLVGVVVVLKVVQWLISHHLHKLVVKTSDDFDDFLVELISKIRPITFAAIAFYVATLHLEIGDKVSLFIRYGVIVVVTIQVVVLVSRAANYGVDRIYVRKRREDPTAQAISQNLSSVLVWVVWALGAVFILDNLGVNISALVAGLGIGGIAIAMASQTVLGDAFSGLAIIIDKPFLVGDFIIVGDLLGVVEHVGIKTTRIRSLFGEQLIFSNSDLTSSRIKNYKRMKTRRIAFKIGVVYETPYEKVKEIPSMIKGLVDKVEGVKMDRVHFFEFADFSLIYEIVYHVLSPDYNIYMDKQQEINLAIMEAFEKEKIVFAYPTQQLYLTHQNKPS